MCGQVNLPKELAFFTNSAWSGTSCLVKFKKVILFYDKRHGKTHKKLAACAGRALQNGNRSVTTKKSCAKESVRILTWTLLY